jgi:predicted phosphodiesterase
MRIAIFSDVHGFDHALRTVLDDLDRHGPFDEIVAAGDHCELGPGPADALDLLLSRGVTLLLGNTDLAIVEGAEAETDVPELRYAIARLGPERIAILAALPFSRRITPPGGSGPNDDLLIVHATPHSLVDRFQPDWSDDRLRQIVGPARARVIVFGHHHVCFVRRLDGLMLVDVSAVGNPKGWGFPEHVRHLHLDRGRTAMGCRAPQGRVPPRGDGGADPIQSHARC